MNSERLQRDVNFGLLAVNSPGHQFISVIVFALMCFMINPGYSQSIHVDFVEAVSGRIIDLAVSGQGRIYLLGEDGLITAMRPPEEPRRIVTRENVNKRFSFDSPAAVAVDRHGDIFICDEKEGTVTRFDSNGMYISHFGPAMTKSDAIDSPVDLAIDLFDRVFVADKDRYVHIYNTQGVYLGRLTDVDKPVDVGVDGFGNIYVLDSKNSAIQLYDVHFASVARIPLKTISEPEIKSPEALFVEPDGTVYVTDLKTSQIVAFSPLLPSEAPVLCYTRIGIEGEGRGEFRKPVSVAVDGYGRLYVADEKNNNVQVFEFTGFAEQKRRIRSSDTWALPVTVEWMGDIRHSNNPGSSGLESFTVDEHGTIYCVDSEAHSISAYDADGQFVMTFGTMGEEPGRMKYPRAAVASDKDLFVLDSGNHRIQTWSMTGMFQSQFGSKGRKPVEFNSPTDLILHPNGALVIADKNNNRIQIIGTDGELLTVVGSIGKERLEKPTGVAVGSEGKLYICEEDRRLIKVIDISKETVSTVSGLDRSLFQMPVSIAADERGMLYVLDAQTGIFVLEDGSRLIAHFASYGNLVGQFMQPTEIRIAPGGEILVSDAVHNKIAAFRLGNLAQGAVTGEVLPPPPSGMISLLRSDTPIATDSLRYDGSFLIHEVSPGEVTVSVNAAGFTQTNIVTAFVTAGSVIQCEPLILQKNGEISGVVIPAAQGAVVTLMKNMDIVRETSSDPGNGTYYFDDIRPGIYSIAVKAPGYTGMAIPKPIHVQSGTTLPDTMYLKRPGSAGGVVTPPEAGAMGTIYIDSVKVALFAVRSDNGVFETPELYPGVYTVALEADNYIPRELSGVEIHEGERFDMGVIQLERVKMTTPEALRLLNEAKTLHLAADFEGAQAILDSVITTEEMSTSDLATAKLWLAYSYFPFSKHKDKEMAALREAISLDPDITVDESFSPGFIQDIDAVRSSLHPHVNEE